MVWRGDVKLRFNDGFVNLAPFTPALVLQRLQVRYPALNAPLTFGKVTRFSGFTRVLKFTDIQVRRIFAKAELKNPGQSVHPHEMRQVYVKRLIGGGIPIEAASNLIGYSDPIMTTQWYYRLTGQRRRATQEKVPV